MLVRWVQNQADYLWGSLAGFSGTSTADRVRQAMPLARRDGADHMADIQHLQDELTSAHKKLRATGNELDQERKDFDEYYDSQVQRHDTLQEQYNALFDDFEKECTERSKDRERDREKYRKYYKEKYATHYEEKYSNVIGKYRALLAEFTKNRADGAKERELLIEQANQAALLAQRQQQEAEKCCRKVEQEKQSLTVTVRDLQASALRSVESTRWAPHSHSDVERQITSILSDVREWCGNYASVQFEQFLGHGIFETFASSLSGHACIASPDRLRAAICNSKAIQRDNNAATQLFSAAATSAIFQRLLSDPFHAFRASSEGEDALNQLDGAAVSQAYSLLRSADEGGAEAWRCQLLRLVDTLPIATHNREAAGIEFVKAFVAEYVMPSSHVGEAMQTSLLPIVSEVAELSRGLWTRKTRIVVMGLAALAAQSGQAPQLLFKRDSEYLEAHVFHNAKLDDDPHALDDKEVIMVCSPAVVVFGNAKGEDYDKSSVVKKAVVWMG